MAKKYSVRDVSGNTLFAGSGDDVSVQLARVKDFLEGQGLAFLSVKVVGWPNLQTALIQDAATDPNSPFKLAVAAPVAEAAPLSPITVKTRTQIAEDQALERAENAAKEVEKFERASDVLTNSILLRDGQFRGELTALSRAKGKSVDIAIDALTKGADIGILLGATKGKAQKAIIEQTEQASILRLAKQVQNQVYDGSVRAILTSYGISYTVYDVPGKGVPRSEWLKIGRILEIESVKITPKGNLTPDARRSQAALARWRMVQSLADALRDCQMIASKPQQALIAA